MSEFHRPNLSDLEWLKRILSESQPVCCDYSAGNLLGWSIYYGEQIAEIEDCLVLKSDKGNCFGFPQGKNFKKALQYIIDNFSEPLFYCLTPAECDLISAEYPDRYSFVPARNSFDYVYRVPELATLNGKRHHGKRNHISYFEKNNNWSYEEITSDTLEECILMNEKWYENNVEKDRSGIENERMVLRFAAEHYQLLNFRGGLLRCDGEIVAFTFGEKLNDSTFNTHFEKAFSSVRGAYQMINKLFAQNTINDFRFVNREDDVGLDGLRKAKLSYYPEFLVEKYRAVKK